MLRNRAHALSRGFTLTELLAVVAIIVLLTALIVPNIVGARTRAAVRKTEADLGNLATALESYRQAFGAYPADVFPSEDVNNNGVLDTGEDIGVDLNGDGTGEYGSGNGRIDAGDGVVNILDLEWALRTTARGGPFIDEFPRDGWGQQYFYVAVFTRPIVGDAAADPRSFTAASFTAVTREDTDNDGIQDNDNGIGAYADAGYPIAPGQGNGVLDYPDDKNFDNQVTYTSDAGGTVVIDQWELGWRDIAPDGSARNKGFYIYSVGVDGVDNSRLGYEDITGNNIRTPNTATEQTAGSTVRNDLAGSTEDLGAPPSGDLDTGWEDTGLDGRPNTKDQGEGDGQLTTGVAPATEDFTSPRNTNGELDYLFDDINSWNDAKPWRNHPSYN